MMQTFSDFNLNFNFNFYLDETYKEVVVPFNPQYNLAVSLILTTTPLHQKVTMMPASTIKPILQVPLTQLILQIPDDTQVPVTVAPTPKPQPKPNPIVIQEPPIEITIEVPQEVLQELGEPITLVQPIIIHEEIVIEPVNDQSDSSTETIEVEVMPINNTQNEQNQQNNLVDQSAAAAEVAPVVEMETVEVEVIASDDTTNDTTNDTPVDASNTDTTAITVPVVDEITVVEDTNPSAIDKIENTVENAFSSLNDFFAPFFELPANVNVVDQKITILNDIQLEITTADGNTENVEIISAVSVDATDGDMESALETALNDETAAIQQALDNLNIPDATEVQVVDVVEANNDTALSVADVLEEAGISFETFESNNGDTAYVVYAQETVAQSSQNEGGDWVQTSPLPEYTATVEV